MQKAAWIAQDKRKVFLGIFSSRNLQKTFEQVVSTEEQDTIVYKDMIEKLKNHFEGGRNKTLANFEFHKMTQKSYQGEDRSRSV